MKFAVLTVLCVLLYAAITEGKVLEGSFEQRAGRTKRQVSSRNSLSFVNSNEPNNPRYPFLGSKMVRTKRRFFDGLPLPPQNIRLRGEQPDLNPNEGRIEVRKYSIFGMVCDGFWNTNDADVACKELGFDAGALKGFRGSHFGISRKLGSSDILLGEVRCAGTEKQLTDCSHKALPICSRTKTAGVACLVSKGCPFGWSGSNGVCYRLILERDTFEASRKKCADLGATLAYPMSAKDNNFISDMLHLKWPKTKSIWLGGQWRESESSGVRRGAWVWDNTIHTVTNDTAELWFPGFYRWHRGKRPQGDFKKRSCLAASRIYVDTDRRNQTTEVDYFWWDNVSCKQKMAAICQRPYFEPSFGSKNCFNEAGTDYRGEVMRTNRGSICQKWTTPHAQVNPTNHPNKGLGDHNFCRNPDNDIKPWCWTDAKRGIFGYCEADRCDVVPTATAPMFTRKAGLPGLGKGDCKDDQFFCPSMVRYKEECKSRSKICDGKPDCVDSEDEKLDCRKFSCTKDEFYCKQDKFCIRKDLVCDGARDCKDGADEMKCPEPKVNLKLFEVTQGKMLNVSSTNYMTETIQKCAEKCSMSASRTRFACVAFNYLKKSDTRWIAECHLLSETSMSSGKKLVPMAGSVYGVFKKDCGNEKVLRCANGRCINLKSKCNGNDDCGDNSDEKGCKEQAGSKKPFKVRLAGSRKSFQGRVEVQYRGQWGLVCDDGFTKTTADVICKQLGHKNGALEAVPNSQLRFGFGNGNYLMSKVNCKGTETSLEKCPHAGWFKHSCASNQVAGVVCDVDRACYPEEFRCNSGKRCIAIQSVCDGNKDCDDGSDEAACKIEIDLVDGPNKMEGRVRIRRNYIKGTICDGMFDDRDAEVICRSLGIPGGAKAIVGGRYAGGQGIIWLDNLNCRGTEKRLEECPNLAWGQSHCEHSEDAGVRCGMRVVTKAPMPDPSGSKVTIGAEATQKPTSSPGKKEKTIEEILKLKIPCGQRPGLDQRKGRIVNGYPATPGLIPWQVGVRKFTANMRYQGHHCGGTILNEHWILTAAHCYHSNLPKSRYVIRIGDLDNSKKDKDEQVFKIDQMITHPNWTGPPKYDFDLTLIKIAENNGKGIVFSNNVQPACLPTKKTVIDEATGCHVSGWGSIGGWRYPKMLQVADVPVIPWARCKEMYKKEFTPRMQCAGFEAGGIDTCQGDSGGPLVCKADGKWTAWGQCSWGNGCALPNNPGVYARVQYFLDWIKETIERN